MLEKLASLGGLTPDQEVTLAIIHRSLAESALVGTPPDVSAARTFLDKGVKRLQALHSAAKLPSDAKSFITA